MRARRPAGAVLGLLILVFVGVATWQWLRPGPSTSPSGQVTGSHSSEVASSRQRIFLGAFTALSGERSTEAAVEQREAAMGRRYDLQLTYYNWDDPFPDFGEATMARHGRTPVMTWYGPGKSPSDHRTLAEINNGQDDGWILRQAEAIKKFGRPVYLRLMIEMNAAWYRGYSGIPPPTSPRGAVSTASSQGRGSATSSGCGART